MRGIIEDIQNIQNKDRGAGNKSSRAKSPRRACGEREPCRSGKNRKSSSGWGCGRTSYRLSQKCGELSFKGFLLFLNRSFSLRFFCNRKPRHYGVVFGYNKYPPVKRGDIYCRNRKTEVSLNRRRRKAPEESVLWLLRLSGEPGSVCSQRPLFDKLQKTLFFFGKLCYNRKA